MDFAPNARNYFKYPLYSPIWPDIKTYLNVQMVTYVTGIYNPISCILGFVIQ